MYESKLGVSSRCSAKNVPARAMQYPPETYVTTGGVVIKNTCAAVYKRRLNDGEHSFAADPSETIEYLRSIESASVLLTAPCTNDIAIISSGRDKSTSPPGQTCIIITLSRPTTTTTTRPNSSRRSGTSDTRLRPRSRRFQPPGATAFFVFGFYWLPPKTCLLPPSRTTFTRRKQPCPRPRRKRYVTHWPCRYTRFKPHPGPVTTSGGGSGTGNVLKILGDWRRPRRSSIYNVCTQFSAGHSLTFCWKLSAPVFYTRHRRYSR